MRIFIKIITFPVVLVILILACLLRLIFYLAGSLICFISSALGFIMKAVGIAVTICAVVMTAYAIHGMVTGSLTMQIGIITMVAFWVTAFLLDSIWIVGVDIGYCIKELGAMFTTGALKLLKW